MRRLMLVTVAAIVVTAPMAISVKADETITIQEQQKKDRDSVTIKEREKTDGLTIKRDNDVVVKERVAPRKEDEKVIIKEK